MQTIAAIHLRPPRRSIPVAGFSFTLVADDFGISPAVSRGILEALAADRLSGTGAMTNRPYWPAGARDLRANKLEDRAGVHLNLTCGSPLTAMPGIAPSGTFTALKPLLKGARRRALPARELAAEIAAQLDAFCDAAGCEPAFVDGHQHVQMLPQIREALFEAMAARSWQGKVWLRDSADRPSAILRRRVEAVKALAVAALGRGFAEAAAKAGFLTNAGFAGFSGFDPSREYAKDFATYLQAPGKRHLIMCHPGHADAELAAVDPHTQTRENELSYLLSNAFPALQTQMQARLSSVKSLAFAGH